MIIDTHAHLDQPEFEGDLDNVIHRAKSSGIEVIISIGLNADSSRTTIALAEKYGNVWATVGVHPHFASTLSEAMVSELRAMARHPKVVAIGETGLDYYRNRVPREVQKRAFEIQLALAREFGLPVVIHDRDAHDDVMSVVGEWAEGAPPDGEFNGVLHCFSGDLALALAAISYRFAISVAGPVTYPKSERLAEVVRGVPLSALVVETDCPFLAPQQFRGRRNEPAYLRFVVERVAQLRSMPMEKIAETTSDNARRLFRLDEKERKLQSAMLGNVR